MAFQALSKSDLDFLEALEYGVVEDDLAGSPTLVDQLRLVCQDAMRVYNHLRIDKFEVATPMMLPAKTDDGSTTQIALIGMEPLVLTRLVPTWRGKIVYVFRSDDYPRTELFADNELLTKLIGKEKAEELVNWFEQAASLVTRQRQIIDEERRKLSHKNYIENNSYGSW